MKIRLQYGMHKLHAVTSLLTSYNELLTYNIVFLKLIVRNDLFIQYLLSPGIVLSICYLF